MCVSLRQRKQLGRRLVAMNISWCLIEMWPDMTRCEINSDACPFVEYSCFAKDIAVNSQEVGGFGEVSLVVRNLFHSWRSTQSWTSTSTGNWKENQHKDFLQLSVWANTTLLIGLPSSGCCTKSNFLALTPSWTFIHHVCPCDKLIRRWNCDSFCKLLVKSNSTKC